MKTNNIYFFNKNSFGEYLYTVALFDKKYSNDKYTDIKTGKDI